MKTKIESIDNSYRRIGGIGKFSIHKGVNQNKHSILVRMIKQPNLGKTTKLLTTYVGSRQDGLWALTINLEESKLIGVFLKFINDLVESVEDEENELVAQRKFTIRFLEWQQLFEEASVNQLEYSRIIGLIGELSYLRDNVIPRLGVIKGLESWVGPIGADKDFIFENTWSEVKTKSVNKDTIHLNSKTQLFSENIGELIVVNYQKSNILSDSSTNLNKISAELLELFDSPDLIEKFQFKLANINYVTSDYYDKFNIQILSKERYVVSNEFPSIDTNEIHSAITNIQYDIFLPSISNLKIKD